MFGLFAKKPSKDLQNKLGKQGYMVSQVMFHITQKNEFPPPQLHQNNPVRLSNKEELNSVLEGLKTIITEYGLIDIPSQDKNLKINQLAQENSNTPDRITDSVMLLLTSLNSADTIARVYYRDFPEHKPLLEMVNQLAKILTPAIDIMFGNDVPTEVRQAFPHVSSLIEYYRANK